MGLREGVEKLMWRGDWDDTEGVTDAHNDALDKVLALLDQWELLIEGKLWEPKGGSRFDHPEALYIQTDNAALQPLIRLINQEFKPGDRIAIYRRCKNEK